VLGFKEIMTRGDPVETIRGSYTSAEAFPIKEKYKMSDYVLEIILGIVILALVMAVFFRPFLTWIDKRNPVLYRRINETFATPPLDDKHTQREREWKEEHDKGKSNERREMR
jgi:hypothetical protein